MAAGQRIENNLIIDLDALPAMLDLNALPHVY